MNLYDAIHQMRQRSRKEACNPFHFAYVSYSMSRDKSEGIVEVEHAVLCGNSPDSKNRYQDWMLTYQDVDTQEVRQCWQPLIIMFDHNTIDEIE